jgi:hypothetical protein
VDVGGTTMSGGLVTPEGEILSTIQTDTHGDGPGTAVEDLVRIIDQLMSQALEQGLSVGGIGVGLPGLVDADAGLMKKGIERVRVLSKDGTIIHSNRPSEVGFSVEQQSPPCVNCHQTIKPLQQVPDDKRWRIYESGDGPRLLGSMQAIRNEPSLLKRVLPRVSPTQTVLGIVDIAHSLEDIDQRRNTHAAYLIGIALGLWSQLAQRRRPCCGRSTCR